MNKLNWSKKLTVVLLIFGATTVLALMGKMSGDVASVFTGLAVVYPAAQGWVDGRK